MSSEELGAIVFGLGYLALLVGAIRVFGLGRVLMFFLWVLLAAVLAAFKTLGVVAGSRRY